MYSFEKVAKGISAYLNAEVYKGMNDLQEVVARIVVGRLLDNEERIKAALTGNGFIRTFGFINDEGMVDLEGIAESLKKEISKKGRISMSIPMFGKLTFVPDDVDVLCNYIRGA
jgi:hypothetical protein